MSYFVVMFVQILSPCWTTPLLLLARIASHGFNSATPSFFSLAACAPLLMLVSLPFAAALLTAVAYTLAADFLIGQISHVRCRHMARTGASLGQSLNQVL